MGDDWAGRFDEFKDICEVVYLTRTPAISTTALIEKISDRLIDVDLRLPPLPLRARAEDRRVDDRQQPERLPRRRTPDHGGAPARAAGAGCSSWSRAWRDYWTAGFVRNPWARMLSWWRMVERFRDGAERGVERYIDHLKRNKFVAGIIEKPPGLRVVRAARPPRSIRGCASRRSSS